MRDALLALALLVGIFLAFVAQVFIPPLEFASGARVCLVPVLFCAGACLLPYPYMLLLAFVSGLINDLLSLQVSGESVEISVGWSILLLVAMGSICQGVRLLVLRGQWWWPALMSALTTGAIVLSQFLGLTMKRFESGGFFWSDTVTARILVPAGIAFFLSLIFHAIWEIASKMIESRRSLRDF